MTHRNAGEPLILRADVGEHVVDPGTAGTTLPCLPYWVAAESPTSPEAHCLSVLGPGPENTSYDRLPGIDYVRRSGEGGWSDDHTADPWSGLDPQVSSDPGQERR